MPIRRAIYPGSFDPPHNGHLDVVRRAARLFDELIVAVAFNERKTTLFSPEERVAMLQQCTADLPNVRVTSFHGLLVEFARQNDAVAVIRGLRAVTDFEFELQMSLMNRKLDPVLETLFLAPVEQWTYLSSRIVKEIAVLGGDVREFVPPYIVETLSAKLRR